MKTNDPKRILRFTFALAGLAMASVQGPQCWAAVASAVIKSTADSSSMGSVSFEETESGLKVDVKVENVPAGKHGFHIHEKGDCADQGKAAGGHFNPHNVAHGYMPKDGAEHAHSGDMGNIEVGPDGKGSLSVFLPGVYLVGKNPSVGGLSVILHEKEDDFGQPTGNAGGRIGCGIITVDDEGTSSVNADKEIHEPMAKSNEETAHH